jgi:hypothetical protein
MEGGTISDNTDTVIGGGVFVSGSGSFTMSGGIISGNTAFSGGGVFVYSGSFSKTGGTINGDGDNSHTSGDTENTATYVYPGGGNAVYYDDGSSNVYYHDDTLNTGDNISTSQVPASGTQYNWTKQ